MPVSLADQIARTPEATPPEASHYAPLHWAPSLTSRTLTLCPIPPPRPAPSQWFAIERAWTDEIGADISVALTTFIDPVSLVKTHEICLVVAHGLGQRLGTGSANRLFKRLVKTVENEKKDDGLLPSLRRWKRPDGKKLLERRMVWVHKESDVGRKVVRPLLEKATTTWEG